jgi:hypothetical protein
LTRCSVDHPTQGAIPCRISHCCSRSPVSTLRARVALTGRAFTLAQNVTRDQLIARVAQDGVDRKTARRFADDAAGSAISKTSGNGDLAVKGDVLTYDDVHPWRAQYSVVAVAVRTPTLEH